MTEKLEADCIGRIKPTVSTASNAKETTDHHDDERDDDSNEAQEEYFEMEGGDRARVSGETAQEEYFEMEGGDTGRVGETVQEEYFAPDQHVSSPTMWKQTISNQSYAKDGCLLGESGNNDLLNK